ncbi:MAG TPA: DUF4328 domain-containing protein [Chitinophagaceae bacterium]|nr:DUF4328 domain-containing protein [Chitinophagaceae bacterium]
MFAVRPNKARANQVITAFYIMMGLTLLNTALAVWQYFLFQSFIERPANINMANAHLSDSLDRLAAVINLIVRIITIVLFIRWFRRAYYNLHMAAPHEASYEEGWAAGAWFVPILNLFRPYQIMEEVWTGTQRALPHRFPDITPPTMVGVWWALYLGMNISANVVVFKALKIQDVYDLGPLSVWSLIAQGFAIAATLVVIIMIKKISSFEDQLWDEAQNPSDSVFAATTAPGNWSPSSAS